MELNIIGTDHRLQQSVSKGDSPITWVPRDGHRFRRLITFCIEKLGAESILEEAHPDQERTSPTICSAIAKECHLPWKAISLSEPSFQDVLFDPPLEEALRSGVKPDPLAGIYDLKWHAMREEFMHAVILQSMREDNSVLAVIGYIHLGVLARRFASENISVRALIFTYPLIVDEARG